MKKPPASCICHRGRCTGASHDEGASFRAIKDALRRDLALARLAKPGGSVARVAAELGYSEPSAFFRAFQGWTGEAPSAWRRRVLGPR